VRLTPERERALRALSRAPLTHTPNGWVSVGAVDGCWNSFIVTCELPRLQFCTISGPRASITRAGRAFLMERDEVAA
jgi:hypothetical protein